jgi:hypothetical protein
MAEPLSALQFVSQVSELKKARHARTRDATTQPRAAHPQCTCHALFARKRRCAHARARPISAQRLDDGEAELAEILRANADADDALASAAAAVDAARARLADRHAETAKFATKLADYGALLAHRRATQPATAAGREARAKALASERQAQEAARVAFFERCAAFQAAHEPGVVEAQRAAAAEALEAVRREAAEARAQAKRLAQEAAQADDADAAAQARNEQLTATCAGACHAWLRLHGACR